MKRFVIGIIFFIYFTGQTVNVFGNTKDDFLLVGNKRYTIEYAMEFKNRLEIIDAIIKAEYQCYFNLDSKWYDLDGYLVDDEEILNRLNDIEMIKITEGELTKEEVDFDDYDEQIIERSLYIDQTDFIYFVLKDGESIDVILDGKSLEVEIINTQILIKPKKVGDSKIIVKNKNTGEIRHVGKYKVLNIKKENAMKFNADDLTLKQGDTFQLKANGEKLSNFKDLNITYSKKEIIDVDRDGLIKALQPGQVVFEVHNEETGERICFLVDVIR